MRSLKADKMLRDYGLEHLINKYDMANYSRGIKDIIFQEKDFGGYEARDEQVEYMEEELTDLIFEIRLSADFVSHSIENEYEIYAIGTLLDKYLEDVKDNKYTECDFLEKAKEFYGKIENLEGIDVNQKEEYLDSIKDILSYSREVYIAVEILEDAEPYMCNKPEAWPVEIHMSSAIDLI